MKKLLLCCVAGLTMMSCALEEKKNKEVAVKTVKKEEIAIKETPRKKIASNLPTIGILIFEGVIINEVVAPLDVFSNTDANHKALFNVITIAKEDKTYTSAHGLKIKPDYVIGETPKLEVLVVPSSYNTEDQTSDKDLVNFVVEQNKTVKYMASHCAGAFLIGETGIANDKELVTYFGGGKSLKEAYPELKVADDSALTVVQDGKFISSNGSMVSYTASFDLLEKMTSKAHRKFTEEAILFNRLQEGWDKK